jgi:hypothetical protein
MIQQDNANLHAEQHPSLSLPPYGLYSCAAAVLNVGEGTCAHSAPSKVASQSALNRYRRKDDCEHVAQPSARCMTSPMALCIKSLDAKLSKQGFNLSHLQACRAHVEDSLGKHVANFVSA